MGDTTPASNSLISWTAIVQNKLKEYELVTRGTHIKLDIKGKHFTEWNEAVATHAKSMSMNEFFSYGPSGTNSYEVHDDFQLKSRSSSITVPLVSSKSNP